MVSEHDWKTNVQGRPKIVLKAVEYMMTQPNEMPRKMFRFFKRKKKENEFVAMLAFDDSVYTRIVAELFESMDPSTRAHVLVAYENLIPLLSAMYCAYKEENQNFTTEQFIPQVAGSYDKGKQDEIVSRRSGWFLSACLLARLEKLARNDHTIAEIGACIWCQIADDAPGLKVILPENVIWKTEEKEWFDLALSDKKFTEWTINHAMPLIFAELGTIKLFARSQGLFYWPSESRIHFIP